MDVSIQKQKQQSELYGLKQICNATIKQNEAMQIQQQKCNCFVL